MTLDLFSSHEQEPLTVSQLTGHIKATLESSFDRVLVTGEISNFKRHTPSGHVFQLKRRSRHIISRNVAKQGERFIFLTAGRYAGGCKGTNYRVPAAR